jgi:hypothetical protein
MMTSDKAPPAVVAETLRRQTWAPTRPTPPSTEMHSQGVDQNPARLTQDSLGGHLKGNADMGSHRVIKGHMRQLSTIHKTSARKHHLETAIADVKWD